MDYELAKQLKDASFRSQHQMDMDSGAWCVNCPWDRNNPTKGFEDMCFPTLEELIEACGDQYWHMYRTMNNSRGIFYVIRTIGGVAVEAQTPTEAVAMLYLALHGKKQDTTDKGEASCMEGR